MPKARDSVPLFFDPDHDDGGDNGKVNPSFWMAARERQLRDEDEGFTGAYRYGHWRVERMIQAMMRDVEREHGKDQ